MPRGVKTCPSCNKTMGPRTLSCDCGHIFIRKEKEVLVEKQPLQLQVVTPKTTGGFNTPTISLYTESLIFIPGNPNPKLNIPFCPHDLNTSSDNNILSWIDKMKNHQMNYCGRLTRYARSAIKYFVQSYVPNYIKIKDEYTINPLHIHIQKLINENMLPYPQEIKQGYHE